MLSFCLKYLIKPIRENLTTVFGVYSELLKHKSKYIRKFTSQSFSYVLRKVPFDQAIVAMVTKPVLEKEDDTVLYGIADLIVEVVSGQADDLHSKARQTIAELLKSKTLTESPDCRKLIRFIYLKLVNTVTPQKQTPIFEELITELEQGDDETLLLLFQVITDALSSKFGNRTHNSVAIILFNSMNKIASKAQTWQPITQV